MQNTIVYGVLHSALWTALSAVLKQQVERKMEEYSILAYSTSPLGGGVECLVVRTEGLRTFCIKYPLT